MLFAKIFRGFGLLLIASYKVAGSLHMGGQCRFTPSCSDYAVIALREHPPLKALSLISHRLWRCRPGCDFGHDPVPPSSLVGEHQHAKA